MATGRLIYDEIIGDEFDFTDMMAILPKLRLSEA